jgi:hypothetical protein
MKTHGLRYTPTYNTWQRMKQRCYDKNYPDYPDYGAKGITICARWMRVENFVADMGMRPAGKTIDRIDNTKGYFPGNCRWATPREQTLNRSMTRWITFRGQTMCLADWARAFGMTKEKLHQRIYRSKWSVERALTT